MRHERQGTFAKIGRAADESMTIAAAIRDGRLTRRQFDEWYAQRRADGEGLVITLRTTAARLARPVESVLEQSAGALRAVAPAPRKRKAARRPVRRGRKR
jgi:hypothetical protein